MRIRFILLAAVLAAGSGCQMMNAPDHATAKEQATEQWNASRAGILAGLARDQLQNGDLAPCRRTVDQAIKLDPKNASLHVLSARLAIEQTQLDVADRELQAARQLDDHDADAFYLSGVVCQRWQKPQEALEFYRKAAALRPSEVSCVLAEGEMLIALDRRAEALTLLESALKTFDHSAGLCDEIGQVLMQQHQYAEAAQMLRRASELSTDDMTIREHLTLALFQAGEYARCVETLEHLFRDPRYSKRGDLYVCLGMCQLRMEKLTDARDSFQSAANMDPRLSDAWLSLAKVGMQLGDVRRAEIALDKYLELEPTGAEGHVMLGCVQMREKRLNDALSEFRLAASLDPLNGTSLCMIGYVMEKRGRTAEAKKYYGEALKVDPHDDLAARLLAGLQLQE